MPRILVADDHTVVRRQVRKVLESQKGWEVCAEAATGREAVAMTAANQPDIVVLDLSMPELNGLEAARQIHEQFPQTKVIILSMHDPFELIDELREFGVRTWILKTDLRQLVDAIRSIWQSSRQKTTQLDDHASTETFMLDARKKRISQPA